MMFRVSKVILFLTTISFARVGIPDFTLSIAHSNSYPDIWEKDADKPSSLSMGVSGNIPIVDALFGIDFKPSMQINWNLNKIPNVGYPGSTALNSALVLYPNLKRSPFKPFFVLIPGFIFLEESKTIIESKIKLPPYNNAESEFTFSFGGGFEYRTKNRIGGEILVSHTIDVFDAKITNLQLTLILPWDKITSINTENEIEFGFSRGWSEEKTDDPINPIGVKIDSYCFHLSFIFPFYPFRSIRF